MDVSCLSGIYARRKDTDMFCPNCGKGNPDGVAFCSGCGMAFGARPAQPVAAPVAPQPQPVPQPAPQPVPQPVPQPAPQPIPQPQPVAAPIVPPPQPAQRSAPNTGAGSPGQASSSISFGQHFKNLFHAAIHPVTGPAEIAPQYDRVGNAIFLAGIVVVICWMVGFISSMSIDLIHYAQYGKYYFNSLGAEIVKDFFFPMLYYAIRVFGCAGIFMLAGLILKQKWSFARLLAISAMATAPAFIVSDFLGSYMGLIPYIRFGSVFTIAAYAYYLLMLFEGMSAETKLTGNKKGFVLVICVAITGFIANYF